MVCVYLNDLFSCITMEYTPIFIYLKSLILAWAVTSIWSAIWPHKYRATLSRTCTYLYMDFELHCNSATGEIGSTFSVD
ncbi:hypothetical protein THRCLA_22368 [Thraustotheca clavata]|uniref:Secreted protein n=1 Tax=Thraustotheca clavata TaxID=74557 RepID=A0A1V9Z3W4_9STRA|nr:hypothetical protein THRCLA_22368 [Thraustotheca clavata]